MNILVKPQPISNQFLCLVSVSVSVLLKNMFNVGGLMIFKNNNVEIRGMIIVSFHSCGDNLFVYFWSSDIPTI